MTIRNKYSIRINRRTNPIHTVRRVVEEYAQVVSTSKGPSALNGGSGGSIQGNTSGEFIVEGSGLIDVTESPVGTFTVSLPVIELDDLDDVILSTLSGDDLLIYVETTGGGYWTNLSRAPELDKKAGGWMPVDSGTAISTLTGVYGKALPIPKMLDGWNITDVTCTIDTLGSAGNTVLNIKRSRSGSSVDALSSALTCAYNSYGASVDNGDGTINTSNDDVQEFDKLYLDITGAATGAQGLSVVVTFTKP
jgi:hypothetical protein